ncbi:MAG: hypothetical protein U9O98_04635 [Asgard group archaeon]|nr:hypothetical protein [Asgard group archaeon]
MADHIPLAAVIIEGLVFIVTAFIVSRLYQRYFQRRKIAALTLAGAFTSWNLGILFLFVGKLTHYIIQQQNNGVYPETSPDFSTLGINLGYGFSAISNVLIVLFVSQVFSQATLFRKTKKFIPILLGVLNGITLGLLASAISADWAHPEYTLGPTIYHLAMTFLAFFLLGYFTLRAKENATFRWEKAGFNFIFLSALFGFLLYLSFAIDILLQELGVLPSYTPFYYIAYVFGVLMCLSAYLGYVMPEFVRKIFR